MHQLSGRLVTPVLALAFVVALPVACDDEEATPTDVGSDDASEDLDVHLDESSDGDAAAEIAISDLTATQNPVNVLSYFVEWETDAPSPTRLDVTCEDYYDESFTDATLETDHSVFVMGLIEETSCTFVAQAKDELGRTVTASTTVEVDSIPSAFPELRVAYSEPGNLQAGWTLFNLHNGPRGEPPSVVVVDAEGNYRWYYRVPGTETALDNDVRVVSEGILMQAPPQIIDWEGQVVWSRSLPMHHDVRPFSDDDHLIYLSMGPCPNDDPPADVVVEYDRSEDRVVWEWSICEHYTPPEVFPDWSHLNTVVPFPDEDALLLSSRHQNAVFKVDLDSEEVVWRLGENGDFAMDDADLFFNNHSPEIESNGNILLFDNGSDDRRYSRAVELAYDDTGDTWEAEVVWQYVPNPHIFCFSWGDADRLPNGNTLMSFGVENPGDGQSHLIEATSANPGRMVWDLELPLGWAMYRAERIVSPLKGYVVTD